MQPYFAVSLTCIRRLGRASIFPVLMLSGCERATVPGAYQGYIEAEYVYVSSPYGGALHELNVSRGDKVTSGQPLFSLDPDPEEKILQEAEKKLARAQAQLADAQKGMRPSEIEALEAQKRSAEADLELAEHSLKRREQSRSARPGAVSEEEVDQSRSKVASLRSQIERFTAQLVTARLGSREDQIEAAKADVESATAAKARAEWALSQKKQPSGVSGTVHDTLYRPGEWVAPGNPVVVTLPPENIKVRFFVPQAELEQVPAGRKVLVSFDGAPKTFEGTVSYISTSAEFTPPVIYSQQTRSKLVFMVEAIFALEDAAGLSPGQPVDVMLKP